VTPPQADRVSRLIGVLLLVSLWAGCAVHSAHDRGTVSEQVRIHAGHALRPAPGSGPDLPDGVSLGDGLSEDEAVATALWRNAELEVTLAEMGLARADLVEAGLIKNPIFSLLFPLGPKQLEFTLTWPIEALWQRPRRVAAAQSNLAKTAERLVQSGLDLVRDVRLAYAEVLLDDDRARLAGESRDVRERIAAIAGVQLRVGDISPLEAAAVEVEAARARDVAARASRAADSSRDRLLALLGLAGDASGPGLALAPDAAARPELPALDTLLKQAFAARPELRAVELAMEAAGQRAGIARSEILTLSAILDANGSGTEGFEMGPGLALEIPLFGRHKGRLARAEAELEVEARRYVATRERIALEVRQARTAVLGARESLAVWERSVLPALEQNLVRAEQAQQAGETSLLEVLAARRSVLDARLLEAEARAAERRAEAALGHGVGRTLGFVTPTATGSEARP
jgi:cobalt-zinc-cadmium efflux system outer membrane protein